MKKILITLAICTSFVFANNCVRDDATELVSCSDTKLIWIDKEDQIVKKQWNRDGEQAVKYCTDLGDNWRLPNMNELLSIVDYGRWKPAINEAFKVFPKETRFYSSTTSRDNQDTGSKVFFVEFENGTTSKMDVKYSRIPLSIRCVKDIQ